jgi:hypothetical protein
VRRTIEAHLGTRQVARVIYGAIIGMALVVVLQAHPPGAGEVAISLVSTAVAVAVAEIYSEILGSETRNRRHVTREHVREIGVDAAAVAFGVAFPAVFFVLAAMGVMETRTAFRVAAWSGVGLIGFYGFAAGRLAGDSVAASLVQGLGAVLIGVVIIVLKALVH